MAISGVVERPWLALMVLFGPFQVFIAKFSAKSGWLSQQA